MKIWEIRWPLWQINRSRQRYQNKKVKVSSSEGYMSLKIKQTIQCWQLEFLREKKIEKSVESVGICMKGKCTSLLNKTSESEKLKKTENPEAFWGIWKQNKFV